MRISSPPTHRPPLDPTRSRSSATWPEFLHSQAAVACDVVTVDTALLRRYYVLFFIHIPTRRVGISVSGQTSYTADLTVPNSHTRPTPRLVRGNERQ